jgi:hypothetical protein
MAHTMIVEQEFERADGSKVVVPNPIRVERVTAENIGVWWSPTDRFALPGLE